MLHRANGKLYTIFIFCSQQTATTIQAMAERNEIKFNVKL